MGDEAIMKEGLDKDFGFKVNKPFYIVSRLPMERVIEMVSNRYLYQRQFKTNKPTYQQWFFDPVSKTIKS